MKRFALTLFASLFLSSAALALPAIGEPAPDFKAVDSISGKPVTLSSLKGKVVVLEWNNFNCPFVHKFYSVGAMQKLQAKSIKDDDGLIWISINSSAKGKEGYLADAKAAKAALAENKSNTMRYILDHDGAIGHAYGAKTTPHMFVINAEGKVVYMGAIDDKPTADTADIASATNYVTQALNALKNGTKIKTTSTRPYGCFVKY